MVCLQSAKVAVVDQLVNNNKLNSPVLATWVRLLMLLHQPLTLGSALVRVRSSDDKAWLTMTSWLASFLRLLSRRWRSLLQRCVPRCCCALTERLRLYRTK
jgi:hypothetical protein